MRFIFSILILLFSFSCSEDSLNPPEEGDILHFKNADDILSFVKKGEGNSNFVSFDAIYRKAVEELNEAETVEEHSRILDTYSDVIIFANETYTPVLSNSAYRKIINRDRMYISGEYVHKVLNDELIIFSKKEAIDELKLITSAENLNQHVFKAIQYKGNDIDSDDNNGRTATNCGSDLRKDYFYNQSNCRNDRRAWVRAYSWYVISGNQYTPSVISEAWGELRTGTFCNWKGYKTRLSTRSCSFTVTLDINGVTHNSPYTFPDYNGTSDEYQHILVQGPIFSPPGNAITWVGGAIPKIQFTKIHLESSSRGTNGNWAVLDCQ